MAALPYKQSSGRRCRSAVRAACPPGMCHLPELVAFVRSACSLCVAVSHAQRCEHGAGRDENMSLAQAPSSLHQHHVDQSTAQMEATDGAPRCPCGAGSIVLAESGFTRLHIACEQNDVALLQELVSHICESPQHRSSARQLMNQPSRCGSTPLFIAAQHGHASCVALLLEASAMITAFGLSSITPTATATATTTKSQGGLSSPSAHAPVCDLLLRHTTSQATPLYVSCQNGHVEVVMMLIQAARSRSQLDALRFVGRGALSTPLHIAAQQGHRDVVSYLLREGGFTVWSLDSQGVTPLHVAADAGHAAIVSLLLQLASEVSEVSVASKSEGPVLHHITHQFVNQPMKRAPQLTPLHLASRNGHMSVLAVLLAEKHVVVDSASATGSTPLHLAASNGHSDAVEMLLRHGADPLISNAAGDLPRDVARQKGHDATAALLDASVTNRKWRRSSRWLRK